MNLKYVDLQGMVEIRLTQDRSRFWAPVNTKLISVSLKCGEFLD